MKRGKDTVVRNSGSGAWTQAAIQKAVDSAFARGGGLVRVPAGIYKMNNALRLRNGVRVVGEEGTVLQKVPSVSSPILDYLGYGHYELTVAEPDKFHVGMGVHILDDHTGGFCTTVATITGIDKDRLFIDRALNHDYAPSANGRVISVFSLIEAAGVEGASIEKLSLDGNAAAEKNTLNGCRGGGVFFIQSRNLAAREVEVTGYRGDGFSFQQCIDLVIERCRLHDNSGGGLHPGSGSVRYVIRNNHIHDNGGDGIFYCLRTSHSICSNNRIENNAGSGISIGERDTDHCVAHNLIRGNGGPGVIFRQSVRESGDRVRLQGNTIAQNCVREGIAEISIAPGLHKVHIVGNRIEPATCKAMHLGSGCSDIFFESNTVAGRPQRRSDVAGSQALVKLSAPRDFPKLGPAALPLDGARHLCVDKLRACRLPLSSRQATPD